MTENENIWTVYAHINKINRKVYVGITGRDPKKRWGHNGYNYKKSTYFYNAIQKYGWDKTLIKHLKSKTITPYKNYIWKYA